MPSIFINVNKDLGRLLSRSNLKRHCLLGEIMPLSPASWYPTHPSADSIPVRTGEEISSKGRGLLALSAGLLEAVSARLVGSIPSVLQILTIKRIPLVYCVSSKLTGLQELGGRTQK